MIRSEKARRRTVAAAQLLGVVVAYYLSGRLGLLRRLEAYQSVVTPLWPPTGVALAALLQFGVRIWPGIALGALFTTLSVSGSLSPFGIGILAGNTLGPLTAYAALRSVGFRKELDRLRDGVALVFLGAFAGMLVSSTLGCVTLVVAEKLPPERYWPVWACWWAGDVMGVLVVTPILLVLRRARMPRITDRWLEAAGLFVVMSVASLVATNSTLAMLYLVFPVLIWAALRFQLAGSAPCALLVSVLAVISATHQAGPFRGHQVLEVMLNLALLNGSVTLTSLLLSAVVTEQLDIRREMEHACVELADLVEELTPRSAVRARRPGSGERAAIGPEPG
ncbi:MASE1 domain-containing protein [Streptomyces sp. NBC_00102]|uniref:MASE1 domain-containing protein n=1 Tax=Streptomyces sp. NBC_00102 TaxID=2975652 RepID=UPI0022557375|nr:MASE1 domain-containing protein [Streptomyces sp. NBC_00102]MCX5401918.1 MASE1 domain-containing protein [Streptomyces sp. NBC_00102]